MENEEQDYSDYSSNGSEPEEDQPIQLEVKPKTKKQEEQDKINRNLQRLEALKKARETKKKLAEERRLFKEAPIPKVKEAPKAPKLKPIKAPVIIEEQSEEEMPEPGKTEIILEKKPRKPRVKKITQEKVSDTPIPTANFIPPKTPKAPKIIQEKEKIVYIVNSHDELPEEIQKYVPKKSVAKKPRKPKAIEYDEYDKYEQDIQNVGRIIFN